jgi:3-keto-5-aminohexanoate cleavage enzyme
MKNKMVITCALTGAETTRKHNPNLPITAEEIGHAAAEAKEAGASIIHLHVRDEKGEPKQDPKVFKPAIDAIRKKTDVVIEITTGGAVGDTPEDRMKPLALEPEMASLDCGCCNFGDDYLINSVPIAKEFASAMNKYKVFPTLELFDVGHIYSVQTLIKEGLIKPPYHYSFVLGVPNCLPFDPDIANLMKSKLPPQSYFTVMGIGRYTIPAHCYAIASGGFIRTGFEDNVYYAKGELAKSNAQLIERAVRISKEAQLEIATPADVRKMFNLRGA